MPCEVKHRTVSDPRAQGEVWIVGGSRVGNKMAGAVVVGKLSGPRCAGVLSTTTSPAILLHRILSEATWARVELFVIWVGVSTIWSPDFGRPRWGTTSASSLRSSLRSRHPTATIRLDPPVLQRAGVICPCTGVGKLGSIKRKLSLHETGRPKTG